jgi:NADPH:quinone reductase
VTASRPETRAWCEGLGAHHVIDHSQSLPSQLEALSFTRVDVILSLATAISRNSPEFLLPRDIFA